MTTTSPGLRPEDIPGPDGPEGTVGEDDAAHEVPIGETLLAARLITSGQLEAALERQKAEGGYVGQHLLIAGALTRRQLYAALSIQWDLPFHDLIVLPPEPSLAGAVPYAVEQAGGWVPCEYTGDGSLIVAVSQRPTPAMAEQVASYFPNTPISWHVTTPWDLSQAIQVAHRATLLHLAKDSLAEAQPDQSARRGLTVWQLMVPAAVAVILFSMAALDLRRAVVWLLCTADVTFLLSILFKVAASCRRPFARAATERRALELMLERKRRGHRAYAGRIADDDLPVYTVLVPVFREANIIDKLIRNLGSLDYPKSKLDIIVLMEANDTETVEAAKKMRPPEYVRLVVVPEGQPQTKPRACNYGLALAQGEYVVIFDAEDRPDPDQLRKAVAAFRTDRFEHEYLGSRRKRLAVVQASLHYFNADYNVLTRMFAVEYAHWFESMLPGLDGTGVPLPLGGTSNHFDAKILRELGAWDPYNVTEDADLGLRASVEDYRVAVIDSSTGEEACAATSAWIKQRTRWIKGYMITAAVNLRHPASFIKHTGLMGVVGMVGLIGGTPLAFLLYPVVVGFTICTYVGTRSFGLHLPHLVVVASVATAICGNLLMILASGFAARRRYNWRIGIFALLLPAYWLLHSVAAWRALYQTIVQPHSWEKTPHGISEDYESSAHLGETSGTLPR